MNVGDQRDGSVERQKKQHGLWEKGNVEMVVEAEGEDCEVQLLE